MPVLTYRVTAIAEHQSGGRVSPSDFHEAMSDWLADAARECVRSIGDDDDSRPLEPASGADYLCAQVTVEPVDDAEQVSLILERRDVERLAAALDVLTPPGDAGREQQPLLALLRMSLIDPVDVEQRPTLTVLPGGGNPERWSADDVDA